MYIFLNLSQNVKKVLPKAMLPVAGAEPKTNRLVVPKKNDHETQPLPPWSTTV